MCMLVGSEIDKANCVQKLLSARSTSSNSYDCEIMHPKDVVNIFYT